MRGVVVEGEVYVMYEYVARKTADSYGSKVK
jgi:hypothetical protein